MGPKFWWLVRAARRELVVYDRKPSVLERILGLFLGWRLGSGPYRSREQALKALGGRRV